MKNQQIFYIGGGEAQENFDGDYYEFLASQEYNPYAERFSNWKDYIVKNLPFDWIRVPMPNAMFADYQAWKIVFESHLQFFQPNDILITNSLGGGFLFKYLSEGGDLPNNLGKIIFLAPGWKDTPDEKIGAFAADMKKVPDLNEYTEEVHVFHAKDDPVVPFSDSEELCSHYISATHFHKLSTGEHFFLLERLLELEQILQK